MSWSEHELEKLGQCPICGSLQRELAHANLRDNLFACSDDLWNIQRCTDCATLYLDPRPTESSIWRAYERYLTHAPQLTAIATKRGNPRQLLRRLANGYRQARWGVMSQKALRLGRWVIPCLPVLPGAIEQQMRGLPGPLPDFTGELLDVGCGSGAYLKLARSAGWKVFGIDFDAVAVEVARKDGLEVHQGGLDTLRSLASRRFDHVTCSHVLEHVHEPVDWLREVWRVLKPDGTLWIQTPNACSLGHELYGVSWRGLEPPRHLTIWTESNLVKRLASSGFRQIKVLPTSIVTAMDLYASCEALRHGLDYASFIALPSAQRPRLQYLWPALKQRFTRGRSEFLTLVAIR